MVHADRTARRVHRRLRRERVLRATPARMRASCTVASGCCARHPRACTNAATQRMDEANAAGSSSRPCLPRSVPFEHVAAALFHPKGALNMRRSTASATPASLDGLPLSGTDKHAKALVEYLGRHCAVLSASLLSPRSALIMRPREQEVYRVFTERNASYSRWLTLVTAVPGERALLLAMQIMFPTTHALSERLSSERSQLVIILTNEKRAIGGCPKAPPASAAACRQWLAARGVIVFAPSAWHAAIEADALGCPVHALHPPLDRAHMAEPRSTGAIPVDPDKLVYMSAPSKGLQPACRVMRLVARVRPSAQLHVFVPGWASSQGLGACRQLRNVVWRGALGAAQLRRELRSAFAVLFPGGFRETFGCSHLEANCLGVPVLAEATGALAETLQQPSGSDESDEAADGAHGLNASAAASWDARWEQAANPQLLAVGATDAQYTQRLHRWWRQGRPRVSCRRAHYLVEEAAMPLLSALDRPHAFGCTTHP